MIGISKKHQRRGETSKRKDWKLRREIAALDLVSGVLQHVIIREINS